MAQLAEQILGLILLLGGVFIGWRRWIMPFRKELDFQATGMLSLAVLAVMGGIIGSPFWWTNDPNSFSWLLPPLAGRLLGAAGIAFAVTGCYALEFRSQRLIHSYIVLLAVYLAPLVGAILLLHLNRFNWNAPITYAFFAVAGGMAIGALWHLARRTSLGPSFADTLEPCPAILRFWLGVVALITGAWGLSLFIYPAGPWPVIFVWAQDALTSRLIASMLLTLCVAGLLGLQSMKQARMTLWMFVIYGVGASAACFWNAAAGKPVPLGYAGLFCTVGLVSILFLLLGQHLFGAALAKPKSELGR